jgi:hypothetical protein
MHDQSDAIAVGHGRNVQTIVSTKHRKGLLDYGTLETGLSSKGERERKLEIRLHRKEGKHGNGSWK